LARKLKECGVFGVSSAEYLNYAEKNLQEWVDRGEEVVSEMIERLESFGSETKSGSSTGIKPSVFTGSSSERWAVVHCFHRSPVDLTKCLQIGKRMLCNKINAKLEWQNYTSRRLHRQLYLLYILILFKGCSRSHPYIFEMPRSNSDKA
jgi:hypothetical protein